MLAKISPSWLLLENLQLESLDRLMFEKQKGVRNGKKAGILDVASGQFFGAFED